VYQQWQRWRAARVFESIVHDLNELQRVLLGRAATPTAVVFDGRTLQSTPESGHRAGYDGAKKRKGRKAHIAVDTLGHLLSVVITPANEQERAQVGQRCQRVQEITGKPSRSALVTKAIRAKTPNTRQRCMTLICRSSPSPKGKPTLLVPRRWEVERSFAWCSRFRRLVRDYERLSNSLQQLHFVVFACIMLARYANSA